MNFLLLFLGASTISTAPVFAKLTSDLGGVGPIGAAFWRVALAVPVLLPLLLLEQRRTGASRVLPTRLLCLPGVFFALDLAAWHWSFAFIGLGQSTLIANLAVIVVAVGGYLFFRERLGTAFFGSAALALTGVAVLVSEDVGSTSMQGNALGLLTALFYGSYLVSVKGLRGRFSTLQVMTWASITCALVCLPFVLALEDRFWPQSKSGWWAALGLALISHTAGQGLVAYSMAKLPAAFSAVTLMWQPVLTAVIAWMVFDQSLGARQLLGGVIVLAGIVLARLCLQRRG